MHSDKAHTITSEDQKNVHVRFHGSEDDTNFCSHVLSSPYLAAVRLAQLSFRYLETSVRRYNFCNEWRTCICRAAYPPPAPAHFPGSRMKHPRADAVQTSKIYRAGEEERQDRQGVLDQELLDQGPH
jgi:hypothetical protein